MCWDAARGELERERACVRLRNRIEMDEREGLIKTVETDEEVKKMKKIKRRVDDRREQERSDRRERREKER